MLHDKKKYTVTVSGGTASVLTDGMKGEIKQLIVTPTTSTNVWDMTIKDRDGDIVFSRSSETGTLFYIDGGLPVGLEGLERFRISFANVTINENIVLIFRMLEKP